MYIDITWKIALPSFVGLFVIATIVMNSGSAESRGVARSAPASSVCNIHDPFSRCFAGNLGQPVRDLFVEYF